jgi:hypothetical protein
MLEPEAAVCRGCLRVITRPASEALWADLDGQHVCPVLLGGPHPNDVHRPIPDSVRAT